MTNEEAREALEARERQYNAALRYIQGERDYTLKMDWDSILYYASLFSKEVSK